MIDRIGMMIQIVEACPHFAATYASFLIEWQEAPYTPEYLVLADFSLYLIALLEAGNRQELDSAFATIERLHKDGDKYVREAVSIGILESLQNTNLHSTTRPEQFLHFLRPVSLRYWRKVQDFWENGTLVTDD